MQGILTQDRRITIRSASLALAALSLAACAATGTQEHAVGGEGSKSVDEIAKELSNPTAALASLNSNFIYREFEGDLPGADDQDGTSLLFQPTFPFPRDNGYNVLFRPAIPILFSQPVFDAGTGGFEDEGVDLGDTPFDLAYGTTTAGGTMLLAGLAGTLPTATEDSLGKDQWLLGPEVLVGLMRPWGLVGGLVSHQWDVAGDDDFDTSITGGQIFYVFSLSDGWQVGGAPTWSYDHEAASDDAWTLPLTLGIFKTTMLGKRPWKFSLEYWQYLESPDTFGADWEVRFKISPVVKMPWSD